MEYILSENEYKGLLNQIEVAKKDSKEKLQRVCTLVASHMPVDRHWDVKNKTSWGCILNDINNPGYCDDCPVTEECPLEHKEWSK